MRTRGFDEGETTLYKKTALDFEHDLVNKKNEVYDKKIQTESESQRGKYFLDIHSILSDNAVQINKVINWILGSLLVIDIIFFISVFIADTVYNVMRINDVIYVIFFFYAIIHLISTLGIGIYAMMQEKFSKIVLNLGYFIAFLIFTIMLYFILYLY